MPVPTACARIRRAIARPEQVRSPVPPYLPLFTPSGAPPQVGSPSPSVPLANQKDSVLPEPRQAQFDSLLNLLQESRSLDPCFAKVTVLRSGMGLAEPHVAAYAQSVNPRFTIRGLYRGARPKTRYDCAGRSEGYGGRGVGLSPDRSTKIRIWAGLKCHDRTPVVPSLQNQVLMLANRLRCRFDQQRIFGELANHSASFEPCPHRLSSPQQAKPRLGLRRERVDRPRV